MSYDNVIHEPVACPQCGAKITEFQSKSGFCLLLRVTPDQLVQDYERRWGKSTDDDRPFYYAYCPDCGARLEISWCPGHWETDIIKKEDEYYGNLWCQRG